MQHVPSGALQRPSHRELLPAVIHARQMAFFLQPLAECLRRYGETVPCSLASSWAAAWAASGSGTHLDRPPSQSGALEIAIRREHCHPCQWSSDASPSARVAPVRCRRDLPGGRDHSPALPRADAETGRPAPHWRCGQAAYQRPCSTGRGVRLKRPEPNAVDVVGCKFQHEQPGAKRLAARHVFSGGKEQSTGRPGRSQAGDWTHSRSPGCIALSAKQSVLDQKTRTANLT